MREPANNTTTTDCQTTHRTHPPIRGYYFVEAERHVSAAIRLIEQGRHDSATVPMKTCGLMLDLLAGVRTPLRRLGSIEQESAFIGGVRHSWFRLEPGLSEALLTQPESTPAAATPSFPTFGNPAKESYGVD